MTEPTDFKAMNGPDLLSFYNAKAELLDRPPVKRFTDRAAAERRCAQIEQAVIGVANAGKPPATEATGATIEGAATGSTTEPTKENDDMVTKAKNGGAKKGKKTSTKKASVKKPAKSGKTRGAGDGSMVGKGTNREKLLALFEKNKGYQVSISDMMKAVYGKAQKDLKGPVMMVMKGLLIVFKTQKKPWEIRKTRENKENYFGLYNKSDK